MSIKGDDDETAYTLWFFNSEQWQRDLTAHCGHPVHLHHFNEDDPEGAAPAWIVNFMCDRTPLFER